MAAAHLILGVFWINLHIWSQESIIYNITVEFLSFVMFHFRPDWVPPRNCAWCMEIPRSSYGRQSARHCLFAPNSGFNIQQIKLELNRLSSSKTKEQLNNTICVWKTREGKKGLPD